jgi:inner membrane protein
MTYWIWIVLGLVLLGLELLTPGGFFMMFFGVAAIIVGLLVSFGLLASVPLQLLVFAVMAIAALILFRRKLLALVGPVPERKVDSLIGQTAMALEDIGAGAAGKVELRGTSWGARNIGRTSISKGAACRVEQVDGLSLSVTTVS